MPIESSSVLQRVIAASAEYGSRPPERLQTPEPVDRITLSDPDPDAEHRQAMNAAELLLHGKARQWAQARQEHLREQQLAQVRRELERAAQQPPSAA